MGEKVKILAVSRNRRNLDLLAQVLEKEGFQVHIADSLPALDYALNTESNLRIALVDLAGFDPGIWDRCERMRQIDIPFLIISPRQSAALRKESLVHGASGVLVKPLVIRDLVELVRNLV